MEEIIKSKNCELLILKNCDKCVADKMYSMQTMIFKRQIKHIHIHTEAKGVYK